MERDESSDLLDDGLFLGTKDSENPGSGFDKEGFIKEIESRYNYFSDHYLKTDFLFGQAQAYHDILELLEEY